MLKYKKYIKTKYNDKTLRDVYTLPYAYFSEVRCLCMLF